VMAIPALEAIRRTHGGRGNYAILARPGVANLYRDQTFAKQDIGIREFLDATRDGGGAGKNLLERCVAKDSISRCPPERVDEESVVGVGEAVSPTHRLCTRLARLAFSPMPIRVPKQGDIPLPRVALLYGINSAARVAIESRGTTSRRYGCGCRYRRAKGGGNVIIAFWGQRQAPGVARSHPALRIRRRQNAGRRSRFAGLGDRLISECPPPM